MTGGGWDWDRLLPLYEELRLGDGLGRGLLAGFLKCIMFRTWGTLGLKWAFIDRKRPYQ